MRPMHKAIMEEFVVDVETKVSERHAVTLSNTDRGISMTPVRRSSPTPPTTSTFCTPLVHAQVTFVKALHLYITLRPSIMS